MRNDADCQSAKQQVANLALHQLRRLSKTAGDNLIKSE